MSTDSESPEIPARKKGGWPKGKPRPKKTADRDSVHERPVSPKYEMLPEDDDDRLRVPRELIPDGMDYQWVTDSVLGAPMPQRRARFERRGWTPVPAARHDGMFMPKGFQGEINVDGLVLMERPLEYSIQAKKKDEMRAAEQVYVREAQLRGGNPDKNIGFDTQHGSARGANRVSKTYERVPMPED